MGRASILKGKSAQQYRAGHGKDHLQKEGKLRSPGNCCNHRSKHLAELWALQSFPPAAATASALNVNVCQCKCLSTEVLTSLLTCHLAKSQLFSP